MEKSTVPHKEINITEEEKEILNRKTYAKNMLQMELALKKGFDGSDDSKDPEIYFEKYKDAFGAMIEKNPQIIEDFYFSQENHDSVIEKIEREMESYVVPYFKQ